MRATDALVGALATYRLTRLAIEDVITAKWRNKVLEKFPPTEDKWSYVLTCPWCAGMWAGLVVAGLQATDSKLARALVSALAFSQAVGLAEERL